MLIDRRDWLLMVAATAGAQGAFPRRVAAQTGTKDLHAPITRIITEYSQQGFHRTGTKVDRVSGEWLCHQIERIGVTAARESFSLNRVDPITNVFIAAGRRLEGVPLFDGEFTGPAGIRGRLGPLQSDAEIGLADTVPNQAAAGPLGEARRINRHRAIVCITRGERPGLCPSNADSFLQPFGPPVLQVSSEHSSWLTEQSQVGVDAQLTCDVKRTPAAAFNVVATIAGTDATLPPLVVSTPRSGWYSCASERGGGIVCWLATMRTLHEDRPHRPVIFVAFSGHEVGSLGVHAFADRRRGILTMASGWIHFGANIGAATNARNQLAASDNEVEAVAARAAAASELTLDRRLPRGMIPGGEAAVVHRAGGRYVALTGGNALFHHPDDRGRQVVDPAVIMKFVTAFAAVARSVADS
jgi:hypothetical protein